MPQEPLHFDEEPEFETTSETEVAEENHRAAIRDTIDETRQHLRNDGQLQPTEESEGSSEISVYEDTIGPGNARMSPGESRRRSNQDRVSRIREDLTEIRDGKKPQTTDETGSEPSSMLDESERTPRDWELDDETKARGIQGVQDARAELHATRPPSAHQSIHRARQALRRAQRPSPQSPEDES